MLTSSEKGTKNFAAAVNQSQYRTAARFFLSTNVNSHTTAAQRLDCQRWFSRGERSVGIIAVFLSRRLPQSLLGLFHVFECEFPGFNQVRHQQLRSATEYR
jgi:hypothetical protein